MADEFDELQILIEAQAQEAKKELDQLIDKITKSEQALMNTEKTASGFGAAFSKSMSNVDMGGVKGGVKKAESYIKSTAKDLADHLILEYKVEDMGAQEKIRSLTENITKLNYEAGRSKKMTGSAGDFSNDATTLEGYLADLVTATHNAREEVTSEVSGIYEAILHSGTIRIPQNALKEIDWGSLDGLLKQHLNSHKGTAIETFVDETRDAIGDVFTSFAQASNLDMSKPEDMLHVMIGLLQQFRDEAAKSPLFSSEHVNDAVWTVILEKMNEVYHVGTESFKTVSERAQEFGDTVQRVKAQLGDFTSEYADKSTFVNADAITKEITRLQDKIIDLKQKATFEKPASEAYNRAATEAAKAESYIDALKAKLEELKTEKVEPNINIRGAADSADTLNKLVQDILGNLHALYNEGNEKEYNVLENLVEELEQSKQSILSNADAIKSAFGDDAVIIEAIDKGIEHARSSMALLAEEAKNAEAAMSVGAESGISKQADTAQGKFSALRTMIDTIKQSMSQGTVSLFEKVDLARPKESFLNLQKNIEDTEAKLEKLYTRMESGYNRSGGKFETTSTFRGLKADIEASEERLKSFETQLASIGTHTHEINWSGIAAKGKEAFETVKNAVNRAIGALKNFIKHLGAKISDGFKHITKAASGFDLTSKGLAKSLLKVSNMLKLMITRMALRGVINEAKESFKELIQFSDKVADSYNKLRNAIKYLADSLAALVSPIFSAGGVFSGLGNVIDRITDKLVDFINKINQVFSALLGRNTWIKASKQTKNYAKDLDKAGKAAKGALASFDELNNITSQKDSGGDTGTGGSQFKEMPIDPKWLKFADWLKDMWKKADLTDLGRWLGEKLRDALNSIPWGKIQNEARKMAKRLATLLNGFFETPGLAESIGNTIAGTINTALIFAEEFIKNFHWDSFGKFIGTGIVTAIRGVQWKRFTDACTALGKGIAAAFNALINTGVVAEIGTAIGNILLGAVNIAFELITGVDFEKLGEQIVLGIKNFLKAMGQVDESGLNGWQKIGKTLSDALIGLLKTLNAVLGNDENRKAVGEAITNLLNSIDFGTIIAESAKLIINLAKALGTAIVSALKSGEFRKFLGMAGLILGGMLLTTFTGKILGSIGAAIGKQLVSNIATSLISSAPALLSTISASFGTVAASFLPVVGVIALVGVAVYEVVKHWEDIKEAAGLFVERTQEHWENLKAWFSTNMPYFSELVKTTFEGIKDCIFGVVISIQEKIALLKNIFDAISPYVKQIFEGVKTVLGNIIENIKNDINERIEFIKTAFSNGLTFIKDLIEGVSQAILGGVNGNLDQVYQGFVRVFEAIKKYVLGIIEEAKTWGSRIGQNIKQGVENFGILSFGGITNTVTRYIPGLRADGGVYKNGRWQPIERYAAGGLPDSGQMFVARESGAELVGSIGRSTAVMNNDQIVASVSEGVYRAVFSAMEGQRQDVNVVLEGDAEGLFRVVRQQGNDFQRRTGRPVFA